MPRPEQSLGKATAFITAGRARTLGGGGSKKRSAETPNFATLTEEQYSTVLAEAGASPSMIEQELKMLRVYKSRVDSENVQKARARLKSKRTATAREDLEEYFDASARMEDRIRNRKENDENGT